jgi:hypothetical protein
MRNNSLIIYASVIALIVFSGLIVQIKSTSSAYVEAPYVEIHCNVNTSFIDDNLCGYQNCSPEVIKNQEWYFIDGLGFYIKEGIHFSDYTYGNSFNFSEDAIVFLTQACAPDISSVLDYLNENTLHELYYDFYPYHPTSSQGNITQINENWWLRSASTDFSTNSQFWLQPGSIIFLAVLLFLIIIGIILGIKFRKEKKKKQLIILICMIILAIIVTIILFIIHYISGMIAA